MRFLTLALCLALVGCVASGCCSEPAAPSARADFDQVIAEPVDGVCIQIPFTGCKLCLGVSCGTLPPIIESTRFGQPVQPAATYSADPCAPVTYSAPYADPCGSASEPYCAECEAFPAASGSASDDTNTVFGVTVNGSAFDYGMPPALMVR